MLNKIFKFGPKEEDKIEWWTVLEGLENVIPIQTAGHFIPNWWQKTPHWQSAEIEEGNKTNNIHNKGTVRRCPAIPEFMGMGFVVPLWCDVEVNIYENGEFSWHTPAKEFHFDTHGSTQFADWVPRHAKPTIILKPSCPWRVKTPPGISLLQLPMFYEFNPNFTVAPGVIWGDIHHEINQQMLFHKIGKIKIQRGTPLAQYIPVRREDIPYTVTSQTPQQQNWAQSSYYHVRTKFGGGYPQHRKEIVKKGECPHATVK